ncbi:deoxyribose-phosphate aldolase [Nakamurella sp. YIM 132084]|uniref:Deoxyribose-phosphate aldolase n=2 Tax=Nakamurella leprariae TaxID=2803911 RepID=A0A938YFY0_9ACTN|nr:deoxyribose-phosphate aldolase [Nakamurella leprariae]
MRRAELAAHLDVTLLRPGATAEDVRALCEQAMEVGAAAVCVSPSRVPDAVAVLQARDGAAVPVATVCGFPSGAHRTVVKVTEASTAVHEGAGEIDMVIDLGLVKDGAWDAVEADITAVQWELDQHPAVADGARPLVKVILETAALTDEEIVRCCRVAEAAGAAFVKTSTGFHPAGGASVHAVQLMASTVGGRLGIKASGGIADTAQALALIEAGATRLGVSRAAAVLADLTD